MDPHSNLPTQTTLLAHHRAAYLSLLTSGAIIPPVLPYQVFGFALLIAYLLIPHKERPWLYACRWLVLGVIALFEGDIIWRCRSLDMAFSFGTGAVAAWVLVLSWTWLGLERPQWEATRVERRWVRRGARKGDEGGAHEVADGSESRNCQVHEKTEMLVEAGVEIENGELRKRSREAASGSLSKSEEFERPQRNDKVDALLKENEEVNGSKKDSDDGEWEYYWQPYPMDSLKKRFYWVFDLLVSFRGLGWSHSIRSNPDLPPEIHTSLGKRAPDTSHSIRSSVGVRGFTTRSEVLRHNLPLFIFLYLAIDLTKVVTTSDPYFLTGTNLYPPPPYLAHLPPLGVALFRQLFSLFAVMSALEMMFILSPLIFCLALGTRVLGLRGEPFFYPTTWGSYGAVFRKGLTGLWAGWWHQTFHFCFAAPTNFLIRHKFIARKSLAGNITSVLIAFSISGFLHACSSITQFPPTRPFDSVLFFLLHALGIIVQSSIALILRRFEFPQRVRMLGNFVFVNFWLYMTGPLLTEDFARGGIWMYEPLPVSPLRGLGLGGKEFGWWCWQDAGVMWYKGRNGRWWESGVGLT